MRLRLSLLAAALALSAARPALAHSPFLAPMNFAPQRDWVTVVGGMYEETPLVADFALRPGDLFETRPDGTTVKLDGVVQLKGLTAVDAPLPTPGTYRLSTGLRAGRETTWAQVNGTWRPVRPPRPPGAGEQAHREGGRREAGEGPPPLEAVPAGAPVAKSTGFLRADTFVTRGAPSAEAPRPAGEGLEIAPVGNPSAVFLDAPLAVRVLLDGRPLAGASVLARRADEAYADHKTELSALTGADGRAELRLPLAGAYVLETRTPPPSPGARPAEKTYVATLAIEATP